MKDLKQLEKEAISDRNSLETKAFELFVKDKIAERIERTEEVAARLAKLHKIKENETLEEFKKQFNSFNPNYTGTTKEYYIGKIKDKV